MNAIEWIANPPTVRPKWAKEAPKDTHRRNERTRARMDLVLDTLQRQGPTLARVLRNVMGTNKNATAHIVEALVDDGLVTVHSIGYGKERAHQLLALPEHTAAEIKRAAADAAEYAYRVKSAAHKRRHARKS